MRMWRQWEKWEDLEKDVQNYWIHTNILRKPGVCSGKFHYRRKTKDDRIHYYACEECGYMMAVSTLVMGYGPTPFPSRHRPWIPDYCSDPKACQKLLALIAQRGYEDSLIAPVLEALETPTDTLDRALFLSHLALYPKKVAQAFVKGYGARLAADGKETTLRISNGV